MAQDISIGKEIKKIDSLIEYNRLDIARMKNDSIYKQLNTSGQREKYKSQILELTYQKANILDQQDDKSAKPLETLLAITDETEKFPLLSCKVNLLIALCYEKVGNYKRTNEYLDKAYQIYKDNGLEEIYSTYCVRRSSYYRQTDDLEKSFHYARQAKEYAEKYGKERDLADAYTLIRSDIVKDDQSVLEYELLLLKHFQKINNHTAIATSYNNISAFYWGNRKDFPKAIRYSDSAYAYYKEVALMYKNWLPENKYAMFEAMGNTDSAYYYFKQYHTDLKLLQQQEGEVSIKRIEEQYQNDKKNAQIKSKNQQMILIGCLLAMVVFGSVMLFRKNRQINKQNRIINTQLGELTKTLEQKQMLLSELQHRVKNNLQHVISILEIQKESVDFNNIDELIRGNQNRIHSMALLHKKLNVSDHVHEVDVKRYITELSELVKDSYDSHSKKVNLFVNVGIEKISLEKALPLGLIIVELVSNSMKHAFKKRSVGVINIEITKKEALNRFLYADNGEGFDFTKTSDKGLGQEIIKGLIDQLNGSVETDSSNGFELMVYFK